MAMAVILHLNSIESTVKAQIYHSVLYVGAIVASPPTSRYRVVC